MNFWKKLFSNNENDLKLTGIDTFKYRYLATLAKLNEHRKIAFIPITKITDAQHDSKSKFGGLPYLSTDASWPICPNCTKKMQFFLQLDLELLPENYSSGLIQLFYCTSEEPHCESDLGAYSPFSKAVVCRRVDIKGEASKDEFPPESIFEQKIIIEWEEKFDYPSMEEWDDIGLDLDVDDDVSDEMFEREEGLPLTGDKLFGWPHWVQSVEYPNDRATSKEMKLLFQLDSEVNLDYMFGDAGIGHITISPDNQDELAFGWACY